MGKVKTNSLPIVEPRESKVTITEIRRKLSGVNNGSEYELILCLANKVFELENRIKELEKK